MNGHFFVFHLNYFKRLSFDLHPKFITEK